MHIAIVAYYYSPSLFYSYLEFQNSVIDTPLKTSLYKISAQLASLLIVIFAGVNNYTLCMYTHCPRRQYYNTLAYNVAPSTCLKKA